MPYLQYVICRLYIHLLSLLLPLYKFTIYKRKSCDFAEISRFFYFFNAFFIIKIQPAPAHQNSSTYFARIDILKHIRLHNIIKDVNFLMAITIEKGCDFHSLRCF